MSVMESPLWTSSQRSKKQRRARYIIGLIVTCVILTTFYGRSGSTSTIQHHEFQRGKSQSLAQQDRQSAVKKEFLHAWYGYKDHAWMADALKPLSGKGRDQFCGWSATLIDSLDTLWIMGLKEEFDEAVNATVSIDFAGTAANCQINLFESTIRYLGGIMAAYDLSGDARLLPKIVEIGEVLYGQFHTSNGMPCSNCKLLPPHGRKPVPDHNVPLADAGSFYLEFSRLSQITGDMKYAELVTFLTDVFESTQNASSIPGLWPQRVDAASIKGPAAKFATRNHEYSLGALSDSAYEYLIKGHILLGGVTSRYAMMWAKASWAIFHNLLFRANIPQFDKAEVLFSGIATHYYEADELLMEPRIQHLACFAGGMFAMSSKVFRNPTDLLVGRQLTEGCIWAYENSPLGIMPETVTLVSCVDMTGPQCVWNETAWQSAGPAPNFPKGFVSSIDQKYLLRPEAIESIFILYRITGEEYYRDVGWRLFKNIIAQTRTAYGHAALKNVMNPTSQRLSKQGKPSTVTKAMQMDEMESFWFAETLKYFWLLFADPNVISLDDWVLNTEAHPFKLTKGIRGF